MPQLFDGVDAISYRRKNFEFDFACAASLEDSLQRGPFRRWNCDQNTLYFSLSDQLRQVIKRPEHPNTLDPYILFASVIINKSDRFEVEAGITLQVLHNFAACLPRTDNQCRLAPMLGYGGLGVYPYSETRATNYQNTQDKINSQHGAWEARKAEDM